MLSVALVVTDLGDQRAKVQSLLMRSFALGVAAVNSAVAARRPVLQKELFERTSPEFPHKLLEVMEQLQQLGSTFAVFRLSDGQAYVPEGSYEQITPDRLRTMIRTDQQLLEEQRLFGELEDGE